MIKKILKWFGFGKSDIRYEIKYVMGVYAVVRVNKSIHRDFGVVLYTFNTLEKAKKYLAAIDK